MTGFLNETDCGNNNPIYSSDKDGIFRIKNIKINKLYTSVLDLFSLIKWYRNHRTLSARDNPVFKLTHKCLPADPASGIPAKDNPPNIGMAADYLDRLSSQTYDTRRVPCV